MALAVDRGTAPLRIVVAVLTYRRPHDLEAIIPALLDQARTVNDPVLVLVVDNDPEGGARSIVSNIGRDGDLAYAHEPTPGIAAARNRALDEATDRDVLVFIDDDERPSTGWLAAIVLTYRSNDCQAVVGRVISVFAAEPDPWIVAGSFFDRPRHMTGDEVLAAATHNLLLDLGFVRAHRLRFDGDFGMTGGSDTLFTRQLHAAGGRILWCDEAVALEPVPDYRATRSWVIRRAFRGGNTRMRVALALAPSGVARGTTRLRMCVHGIARLGWGVLLVASGFASGNLRYRASGVRAISRGAGVLSAAAGGVYAEYQRPGARRIIPSKRRS